MFRYCDSENAVIMHNGDCSITAGEWGFIRAARLTWMNDDDNDMECFIFDLGALTNIFAIYL